MRIRLWNAEGKMKQFVGESIPKGWYIEPPVIKKKLITDNQQEACDEQLRDKRHGLTLSSFIRIMGHNRNPNTLKKYRPLYEKVIERYGDKIHVVKRGVNEGYQWLQQTQ